MKNGEIYYSIKKVDKNYIFKKQLNSNILEHIKNSRFKNYDESLFAWNILNEHFNLESVSFLKSGKPISKNGSLSITHSNGFIAVAFSNNNAPLGIDIELVKENKTPFLKKFFNCDNLSELELFNLWTEHEATVKANDLNALRKCNLEFNGLTKNVSTKNGVFSLSIYSNCELEIIEI